jgi:hypothetical protein
MMLKFIKLFFCIYWNENMIFIFHSVNEAYHTYWLVHIELSWHPKEKLYLITMYELFNMCLDLGSSS